MTAPGFLKGEGLVDSFAAVTPNPEAQHTWQWNYRGTILRYRIDHIFHNAHCRTSASRIIETRASDHFLVVSTLAWGAPAEQEQAPRPAEGKARGGE